MQGYLLTFFTQQSRTHAGEPLADWLLTQAREVGARGATVVPGSAGFGHDGRFHSGGFVDMEDRPLQVETAVSAEECERLLARIAGEGLRVFYTRAPIEFGFTAAE